MLSHFLDPREYTTYLDPSSVVPFLLAVECWRRGVVDGRLGRNFGHVLENYPYVDGVKDKLLLWD
jgi:hypothetical protein